MSAHWVGNFSNLINILDKCDSTFNLTLSLLVTCCAGHNTGLPSNSNISKTVRVNIAFTTTFLKEYLISFLMISRLADYAIVVL